MDEYSNDSPKLGEKFEKVQVFPLKMKKGKMLLV